VERWRLEAAKAERQGAGPLRIHTGAPGERDYIPASLEGFQGQSVGADLILNPNLLHSCYPYLSEALLAGLHVRRAGWLSAQQLGKLLLEGALASGCRLIRGQVQGIEIRENQIQVVRLESGEQIQTTHVINAAGPYLHTVGQMMDVDLPVRCELHQKAALMDTQGVVGRDSPLLIYADPQRLDWTEEERQVLAEDEDSHFLLEELPSGAHTRPDGGPDSPVVLLLWEPRQETMQHVVPPPTDPFYAEIALRGLQRILPGLSRYLEKPSRPIVDGGYYVKTPENRPLIGRLPVRGAYVYGALSGYGIMAACAGGELIAKHISGEELPEYASAFSPARYEDPAYQEKLENWGDDYQL
jgi:glycine/D-amino acid oxidase-like deaminating enzyme